MSGPGIPILAHRGPREVLPLSIEGEVRSESSTMCVEPVIKATEDKALTMYKD